jgi:hypothetical protein
LDIFKYRTGTYTISAADQRNGWNYARVVHTVNASDKTTTYFEWVNDAQTDATTFGTAVLDNLTLTGSKYLSGVRYYTGGDADYDITISNLHRNTYSNSASAISHPTTGNCDVASASLGPISSEADQLEITNKTVTINPDTANRILGGDLSVSTQVDRTVQSDLTSPTQTGGWRILLDNATAAATNASEDFNGESYRQASNLSITNISYSASPGSQPSVWDSALNITSGGTGYNDGLIVYNGSLRYPTQGIDSGDFRNVADGNATGGPTTVGGYAGNPNYSAASGNRVYLRYFYDSSARQNFRFNVTTTSTTFVTVATGPSGNNVTMEILAPSTTSDGSGVVWKDAVASYTSDVATGAYASTFGSSIPTNWGVTLGTKSTATSGNAIVIRITASASWTGSIDNISVTML